MRARRSVTANPGETPHDKVEHRSLSKPHPKLRTSLGLPETRERRRLERVRTSVRWAGSDRCALRDARRQRRRRPGRPHGARQAGPSGAFAIGLDRRASSSTVFVEETATVQVVDGQGGRRVANADPGRQGRRRRAVGRAGCVARAQRITSPSRSDFERSTLALLSTRPNRHEPRGRPTPVALPITSGSGRDSLPVATALDRRRATCPSPPSSFSPDRPSGRSLPTPARRS